MSEHRGCPTCGCRTYSEYGPCQAELMLRDLRTALKVAAGYVRATHATLPNPENIVKPDLDLINAAIARAKGK